MNYLRLFIITGLIFFFSVSCRQTYREKADSGSRDIVYIGDSLSNIAVPVGGIATGDILIGGRGNIRSLEIFNHADMAGNLPYMTFFSMWCKPVHGQAVAKILEQTGG